MSEPTIIRSDHPHEVTIPEGSNKALAKTAAQQEPSVRKVLNEEGGEVIEHILPDKFVSDTPQALDSRPDKFVNADAAANTQVPDQYVKVAERKGPADATAVPRSAGAGPAALGATLPPGPAVARDKVVLPQAGAQASGSASESSNESALPQAAKAAMAAPDLPEMDFPARVVHLRIENELLQKRLDDLDKDN